MPNQPTTIRIPRTLQEEEAQLVADTIQRSLTPAIENYNALLVNDTLGNRLQPPPFDEVFFYATDINALYVAENGTWIGATPRVGRASITAATTNASITFAVIGSVASLVPQWTLDYEVTATWVSSITASGFTVNVSSAPGASEGVILYTVYQEP
jgi:hypothetical protein